MSLQVEGKYWYLIENIYTFRILFAVCFQITIQLSQGRVIPVIAPQGNKAKLLTTAFFWTWVSTPDLPPCPLDNFVFVLRISILSPGFVTLIGNHKDCILPTFGL